MVVICNECSKKYDDKDCSTICPHEEFLPKEIQVQKDLAFGLIGKRLRFAHEANNPNGKDVRIMCIGWDGMVQLHGWTGEFAPSLFVEVK
jgi:hypothetical protein